MPRIKCNGLPEEEYKEHVRKYTNKNYFKRTWKNKYNIKVNDDQIDEFMEHKRIIEKILPILDFIKTIEFYDE